MGTWQATTKEAMKICCFVLRSETCSDTVKTPDYRRGQSCAQPDYTVYVEKLKIPLSQLIKLRICIIVVNNFPSITK